LNRHSCASFLSTAPASAPLRHHLGYIKYARCRYIPLLSKKTSLQKRHYTIPTTLYAIANSKYILNLLQVFLLPLKFVQDDIIKEKRCSAYRLTVSITIRSFNKLIKKRLPKKIYMIQNLLRNCWNCLKWMVMSDFFHIATVMLPSSRSPH